MKQTRIIKILIFSCIVALILAGCGTKAPSWDAFEGALNEKNFLCPKRRTHQTRLRQTLLWIMCVILYLD